MRRILIGDKRTAFAAAYTFLAINGWRVVADAHETYAFLMGLYDTQSFKFGTIVSWLRRHIEAVAF